MTGALRLGPLPKTEIVRLTIALPATVKADLDRYAQLYAATYGEPVDAAALAPHMLAEFMARDRGFRRARQGSSSVGSTTGSPATIRAATAKASSTAAETSGSE